MLSSTSYPGPLNIQWRHVFPRAIGGTEPIVIVFELDSKEKEN